MSFLCFGWLYFVALLRGLRYSTPAVSPLPDGHTGVTCGLVWPYECWLMYLQGWKPWCISLWSVWGSFAVLERENYETKV